MTAVRKAVLMSLYGAAALASVVPLSAALAQSAQPQNLPQDKKDQPIVLETINVVGSRRANASATDTPVPVDFIPI